MLLEPKSVLVALSIGMVISIVLIPRTSGTT